MNVIIKSSPERNERFLHAKKGNRRLTVLAQAEYKIADTISISISFVYVACCILSAEKRRRRL